jgi:hypothetical protein
MRRYSSGSLTTGMRSTVSKGKRFGSAVSLKKIGSNPVMQGAVEHYFRGRAERLHLDARRYCWEFCSESA